MNRTPDSPTVGYLLMAIVGLALFIANPLTALASNYNSDIALAGVGIYGSLRGITSVMSLVKDTDVQASIPLFSVATSPGQTLQPVIATIERMSNLLFALIIASGVLSFTLPIVSALGSAVLVFGACTKALVGLFAIRLPVAVDRALGGCISLGVLAAIGIPLAYSSAFVIGDRFTSEAWEQASEVFHRQAEAMESVDVSGIDPGQTTVPIEAPSTDQSEVPNIGFLDWVGATAAGVLRGSTQAIEGAIIATTSFADSIKGQLAAGTGVIANGVEAASALFEASVQIGVAYLVKLIVLPLLVLLGFLWLMRSTSAPVLIVRQEKTHPAIPTIEHNKSDHG